MLELDKVKLALRISHNKLDAEILDVIESAALEMKRAGVPSDYIGRHESNMCQLAYVKWYYATEEKAKENYFQSFQYQLDCLRKSQLSS